jgi:hypothetical protein
MEKKDDCGMERNPIPTTMHPMSGKRYFVISKLAPELISEKSSGKQV